MSSEIRSTDPLSVVNGSKEIEFFVTSITAAARDKLNLKRKKLFEKSWVSKTKT
jgi:hypothetical protein